MYRHILAPIDCSEDARRLVPDLARYISRMPSCQMTLVATVTPSPIPQINHVRQLHARETLHAMHNLFLNFGVYAFCRVAEGDDTVTATLETAHDEEELFDLIVLGSYQTRTEADDFPCEGSFADKICRKSHLPVYILPAFRP